MFIIDESLENWVVYLIFDWSQIMIISIFQVNNNIWSSNKYDHWIQSLNQPKLCRTWSSQLKSLIFQDFKSLLLCLYSSMIK